MATATVWITMASSHPMRLLAGIGGGPMLDEEETPAHARL
jgi:hypothetical protein